MHKIILKVRYVERGLSKTLKKGNFISSFESSPGYETSSEKSLY